MGGPSPCWARPRLWPGHSTIESGWDECWPGWPVDLGRRATSTVPWRRATREGHGATPITAHACLGRLYLGQGDLEGAIRVLEQGLVLCRASGNRNWLRVIGACLGYAYALHGRLAEGRALVEEAIRES